MSGYPFKTNGHANGHANGHRNGGAPAPVEQIVVFHIDTQAYGLPISAVREVVPLAALLELAGAPPVVRGLLNRRGAFLPVLDGRVLTGRPPRIELDSQILLLGAATPELGLLVDEVSAIRDVRADSQQAPGAQLEPGMASAWLRSVWRVGDENVLLLDFAALRALAPGLNGEHPRP